MRGPQPVPLALGIGQRIRALRDQHGLTVEQLAGAARWVGLDWTGNTVTAVELGRRDLKANELLMLPWVFLRTGLRGEDEVTLTHLLPDGPVTMTPGGTVAHPAGVAQVLRGETMGVSKSTWSIPQLSADLRAMGQRLDELSRELTAELPPRVPGGSVLDAARDAAEEAAQKAARRLGYTALQVQHAARDTWGRTLTQERDARTDDRIRPGTAARSVQGIRARVTRDLLAELEPVLARYPRRV